MSTTASPIDRLRELGGELFFRGDRLRYRIPADHREARQLLSEIRQDRAVFIEMLRDLESRHRAYIWDLRWRLAHPDGYAAPPLADVLVKLADAGLSLVTDGDCPLEPLARKAGM